MASKPKSKKPGKKPKKSKRKIRTLKKKHPPCPHALVLVFNKRGGLLIGTYRTGTIKKGDRGAPGGGVERGETVLKAARRELKQEAAVRVRVVGRPFMFRYGKGGRSARVHVVIGRIKGRPRATREMHRFKWPSPQKALAERKLHMRTRQAIALALPRLRNLQKHQRK